MVMPKIKITKSPEDDLKYLRQMDNTSQSSERMEGEWRFGTLDDKLLIVMILSVREGSSQG